LLRRRRSLTNRAVEQSVATVRGIAWCQEASSRRRLDAFRTRPLNRSVRLLARLMKTLLTYQSIIFITLFTAGVISPATSSRFDVDTMASATASLSNPGKPSSKLLG
ncbi:MAG: hypothetical protein ACREBC_32810, partial [Pyrinomonadaceae bacterium]